MRIISHTWPTNTQKKFTTLIGDDETPREDKRSHNRAQETLIKKD